MIYALLLAVVVAGHPPIDRAFEPSVGDHVSLGSIPTGDAAVIQPVVCFSTVENVRLYFASIKPEAESDLQPDGYMIRAATHVVLRDKQAIEVTYDGKSQRIVIAKVELLGGEFQAKVLFTPAWNLFRFVDHEYPPAEKGAAKKRPSRKRTPGAVPADVKLVLTDLTTNLSQTGNYVNVDGRVRCTSAVPINFVGFTVSFEDKEGRLVRSETGFCTPLNLNPGDVGSISVMAQSDPRYASVKIDFKDMQKAISWVDQSGTNAHQ